VDIAELSPHFVVGCRLPDSLTTPAAPLASLQIENFDQSLKTRNARSA
jgi:hypothetical protein